VLTHAGKPVFTNRKEEDEEGGSENVTNLIGVMHALISVFEDDNDKIRCGLIMLCLYSFSSNKGPLPHRQYE
jgi:hypothetical protein